jgi:hypothetical protein
MLKEAARSDAIDVDRLAVSVSIAAGPMDSSDDSLDAADGARHEIPRLDRFGGRQVFCPLLCSLEGRQLPAPELARILRRHLNRGYDLLFRAFQECHQDWEAMLERLSPRQPVSSAPASTSVIDVPLGRDLDTGATVVWPFNLEGGGQTNSNIRIAGVPGVGKSQVLLNTLCSIAEQSPDTGFILLDYKGDLATQAEFVKATGARVIRPGDMPIPINPFQLPANVNLTLAPRTFAGTFRVLSPRIGPVQESLLARAMESCYERFAVRATPGAEDGNVLLWPFLPVQDGVLEPPKGRNYPTLDEVVEAVAEVYALEGKTEDTVLATLRDLTRYNLFADHCECKLPDLFKVRWVIDLASLPTLKDFVAFVLVEFLHQVARSLEDSTFEESTQRRLIRGIVAVDEAHYYLKARCRPLLDLIRIGRSKGVPVFLSSQSLEDFRNYTEVNEFLPTTFVFRHGVPPDRKTVAGALHVGYNEASEMGEMSTSLDKFHALVGLATGAKGDTAVRRIAMKGFFERNR